MASVKAEVRPVEQGDPELLAAELSGDAKRFISECWGVEPLDGIRRAVKSSSVSPCSLEGKALTGLPENGLLCWSVFIDDEIAAIFGCSRGELIGTGAPWLVTAPAMERVKLRFIRQSRAYIRTMLGVYPILSAYVYRGNKPLAAWLKWAGFEFQDISAMFARGELRAWDCQWL